MWVMFMRASTPDYPYWPGRQWLAAVDAVVWPATWVFAVSHAPAPLGIVGPVVAAAAVLSAIGRLHRAMFATHRYRFTTWRWGRLAVASLLLGLLLKVLIQA